MHALLARHEAKKRGRQVLVAGECELRLTDDVWRLSRRQAMIGAAPSADIQLAPTSSADTTKQDTACTDCTGQHGYSPPARDGLSQTAACAGSQRARHPTHAASHLDACQRRHKGLCAAACPQPPFQAKDKLQVTQDSWWRSCLVQACHYQNLTIKTSRLCTHGSSPNKFSQSLMR